MSAVSASFVALLSASQARADDFVVLNSPGYRTVVVADLNTLERSGDELRVGIFVFPRTGSGADMLQAAAVMRCGKNIMNSDRTAYYDVTIAQGRLDGLRLIREEVSNFDGNTGTQYGLDNSVYAALLPLCSGTPTSARREKGDENGVVGKLAPEFVP
ncbi:hypothetical protein HNP52_003422 [Sphingomonas kyeonggiensis]|uniref:Uncharacterized protein n=1 Tax=Sphingomonas kyeonggiensis TaxID=1268553 RepID=A0A7W7K4L0_9SPHN|nr:hypothetical protein [Sphingomonas kyeonggiensis]MBB4840330.1 hypothetical protein [Sphingomonas kyeonggiensis]